MYIIYSFINEKLDIVIVFVVQLLLLVCWSKLLGYRYFCQYSWNRELSYQGNIWIVTCLYNATRQLHSETIVELNLVLEYGKTSEYLNSLNKPFYYKNLCIKYNSCNYWNTFRFSQLHVRINVENYYLYIQLLNSYVTEWMYEWIEYLFSALVNKFTSH